MKPFVAACLIAAMGMLGPVTFCSPQPARVSLHIALRLTDKSNKPIAGMPIRIVAGIPDWDAGDWRGPDAGVRAITGADGTAALTTNGIVDRRWVWEPVGFTPLSIPVQIYHTGVGFEVAEVLPSRHGDVVHHFFYTAEVDRYADGTSGTLDLDRLYEAGPNRRFTHLLGTGVSSPQSVITIDGLALSGAGYRLSDFELDPMGDAGSAKQWNIRLMLRQFPKPVLH